MSLKEKLELDPEQICPRLADLIRKEMEELNREGVIIGLSGGLDSAVIAGLAARAVGPENVLALILPEKDSHPETVKDARLVADKYSIRTETIDLSPFLKFWGVYKLLPDKFLPKLWRGKAVRKFYQLYRDKSGESYFQTQLKGTKGYPYQEWLNKSAAYYRIKHRLRMVVLYWRGDLNNQLAISSANRTEWETGFFVKWGIDGAGDVMPLLPFYKTQVRQLARYLEVPQKILDKAPSPDIMPGITDEYAMGVSYDRLDLILAGLNQNLSAEEIAEQAGTDRRTVEYVRDLYRRSDHLRRVFTLDNQ